MKLFLGIAFLLTGSYFFYQMEKKEMHLPQAKRVDFYHQYHEQKIHDPYHWLREKNWNQETGVQSEEILDYIRQENSYTASYFAKHADDVQKVYDELVDIVDIDYESYPMPDGDYAYYIKTLKGKDYIEHWRIHLKTQKKELILDENALAKEYRYFNLGYLVPSHHHQYIAYAIDIDGSERYKLFIFDLLAKTFCDVPIEGVSGKGLVWCADHAGFYFQKVDEHWRANKVYFYDMSTKKETLIFEEKDATNHVSIYESSDQKFLLINVQSGQDNVIHLKALNKNDDQLKILFERRKNILYSLDSQENYWIYAVNDKGPQKRILRFDKNKPLKEEYADDVFNKSNELKDLPIIGYKVFQDYIAILCKKNGLPQLFVFDGNKKEQIHFEGESFSLGFLGGDYHTSTCLLDTSSLVQPFSVLGLNLYTKKYEVLRTKEIPGYQPNNFETKRLHAISQDGVNVPYTIAYKKDVQLGNAPIYLYGYGSYGYPLDPDFRASFLPLLNRGFIVVLAHIRGGSDLGRAWYEAAKFKTKKKTFEDFIACAEDLIAKGYTKKGNIHIAGGSAGGMLVGAVVNMCPDLFRSVTAMVPFVDVLNTMMDETLPLTPGEFLEWGNPKEKDYYDYIQSYSPYDNVEKKKYPPFYITAGLNDPRVTYWEPAKWAAKLRFMKTDQNILLLETEMGAGHGGPSGKFDYLKEIAKRYVFMLSTM